MQTFRKRHAGLSAIAGLSCYASAQRIVAGGITVLSCSSVRPCVRPETLLTRYLAEYLTHFHQTYRYTNDTLWDRDEHFTVLNEKVKGQGHSGIKYAGSSTFWAC